MAEKEDHPTKMRRLVRKAPTVTPEPALSTVSRIRRLVRKSPETMAAEAAEREKAAAEKAAAEKAAFEASKAKKKADEKAKMEAPVDDKKIEEARKKIKDIYFSHNGKTVEGKKVSKMIATILSSGAVKESYEDVETGLFDLPFVTSDAYGGEGDEGLIDELYKAVKYLKLKVKITSNSYAFYTYETARKVYPANTLNNAIEFYNDSAEERGVDELKKKTAEFNGNMVQLEINSVEDAKHDAAIWRALAK